MSDTENEIQSKSSVINLPGRIISSLVKEEKQKEDGVVITKIMGEAVPGTFSKFNKKLEEVITTTHFWQAIKTGEIGGTWIMTLCDLQSETPFATIKNCYIKDILIKIVNSETKGEIAATTLTIQHDQTMDQPALESAISSSIFLNLAYDESVPVELDSDSETKDTAKDKPKRGLKVFEKAEGIDD